MKLSRLRSLATHGYSLDTETWAFIPGERIPPVVCGSIGWLADGPSIEARALLKYDVLQAFIEMLDNPDTVITGANIADFDLPVLAAYAATLGIDLMPKIFQALEGHKIFCVQIAEGENAIANGHHNKDPRTGGALINPETGKRGRYSLATCVDQVLGRTDAKENDEYRVRFGEFDNLPLSEYPPVAVEYMLDDARNTHETALAQVGHLPKVSTMHNWGPRGCLDCGANKFGMQCLTRRPHRNLHDLSMQVYAQFALSLGASWGFKVDQNSVDIIERHALRNKENGIKPFLDIGLIRPDGSENRSELKRRVATVYGGSADPCTVCNGTGQILSPKAKPTIRCTACRGKSVKALKKNDPTGLCDACSNTGQIPNTRDTIVCFTVDEDGKKQKTCDGTGLILTGNVPRSDKEGIGYGMDVLEESGDECLMSYGRHQADAKILNVYVPYLREARIQNEDGSYSDIPLTLRPNVLLATGRVSYDKVIQLFPREPGHVDKESKEWVPSLRECIVARDGRIFSSEDFKVGELFAHAQSCIWTVGHSDLADALNMDVDPHAALAATVLGVSYGEFMKRKKEPKFKYARQSMKPFSFGRPTGMSPPKIVLDQRKNGQDTPCALGPVMIEDEFGNLVPGYRGMRFCIVMDGAERCGIKMVSEWGRAGNERSIARTCAHCLECADRLSNVWLKQWSENQPYFNFISKCIENGQKITWEMLDRWPHLKEVYEPSQLAPGEMMQHYDGRIRGGLEFCAGANGLFQALLGLITKRSLCRVSRECYDKTVRVPSTAYANSEPSAYGGLESPLLGSRMVGYFHDELFMDHPLAMGHDGATRTAEIMEEEMSYICPDIAKGCAAEPTLMFKWNKEAAKVVDANGRLIPWLPEREKASR